MGTHLVSLGPFRLLSTAAVSDGRMRSQSATASIMKLNILTGRIARPQKTVIYGPEGIGKTTLAAQFPAPIFLDTESGSHHLEVARLPAPKSWDEVTSAVHALSTEPHE